MESMIRETPCHLCVTHSPLVTRVFEATIRQQEIAEDTVRAIARRGVPFPNTGLCLDEVSNAMESCFRRCARTGYAEVWQHFDQSLQGLTGGRPFEAYIPHLNKIIYQEIINHPHCAGYSFLEEGFTSMAWDKWPNERSAWSKSLRNHLRTWRVGPRYRFNRPMFDNSPPTYRAAYAISKHAFQGMPGRTDVSAHVPPLPVGNPPGNTYLILDACYLHHGIRWENYENALVAAVLAHATPSKELRIKFHFADAHAPERFQSICQRLADDGPASVHMLGPDFSVEENLTSTDLLLFAVTSLGYYAALAGASIRCFAADIEGLPISSWIANGRLPADFSYVIECSSLKPL